MDPRKRSVEINHIWEIRQKAILNAFGMTAKNINRQAMDISSDLARIEIEAAEAGVAKNSGKVSG